MRFAFVPFAVLAASFSLVNAQNKIDLSKPPQPPPPADVFVLNFPDVQGVAGTVSVDNLPALQTVGGTVNVGNLPLAEDGAVRVAGACPATPPPLEARYINLIPGGPLTMGPREVVYTEPVDARGFSRVGMVASGWLLGVIVEWTWANFEALYGPVADPRNGNLQTSCSGFATNGDTSTVKQVCVVSGEQVRLRIECWDATCPVTVAGLYLIP